MTHVKRQKIKFELKGDSVLWVEEAKSRRRAPRHYGTKPGHFETFTFPQAREWAKRASERTSERSRGREWSEQSGASERVSGVSERAKGRASCPVLNESIPESFGPLCNGQVFKSGYFVVRDHNSLVVLSHYGTKKCHFETWNHLSMSSGVNEWASEQTNKGSRVRESNEHCGAG